MGEGGCVLVTFTSTANGYECNIDGLFFLVSFFFLVFFFFFYGIYNPTQIKFRGGKGGSEGEVGGGSSQLGF